MKSQIYNQFHLKMSDLKVIGAGFGRTGTFSLKSALEYLGFGPCHHMREGIYVGIESIL